MKTTGTLAAVGLAAAVIIAPLPACDDDDGSTGAIDNTGQSCASPAECYPNVDAGALAGEIQCLSRVPGGYCTHLCQTDADCCAVPGECVGGFRQVCSPFESTGQMMCFLACEGSDIGGTDANAYCQGNANSAFNCRSSGGGARNRKVCVP